MPKAAVVLLLFGLTVVLAVLLASQPAPPPLPVELAVVVLDAGHGGPDPGAVVAGVEEKDVNLAIALRVQRKAEALPGLRVVLTRTGDVYPTLDERLELAESLGAKAYVSVHANYYRDPKVCGVETWVDTGAGRESLRLAQALQEAVASTTGAPDRGVHRQTLYLRRTPLPTALVEVGYLSCPAERAKLQDPAYQDRIASGILQGILAFLGAP
ncbi:MAG: N-acetylmuramoyl-L-alanine amidase [Candidatus Bipolaricaulota bacterium]|nr:N-acetylmuramoyl-L-alanine amidase [Candidatus Bipolaricaulota bacterium]